MLNECRFCGKVKCKYCLKFSQSKELLINCGVKNISDYVFNFLTGYFNTSDLTNYFFQMGINFEIKEKITTTKITSNQKKIIIINCK